MNSIFLSNLHHAYAQTDGTYTFPNSREGDMLKQAKREIESLLSNEITKPFMKIKQNLKIYTNDFWYDVVDGGHLKPETILEDDVDINAVSNAVKVLKAFRSACEEQIEDFIQ
jgi:hypothetical protein